MRIAHIVTHEGKNGVVTSLYNLISAQQRRGHDIFLVSRPGSWLGKQEFPAPMETMESYLETKPREIARVGYRLRDWECSVIHCHGSRSNKYGMVFRLVAGSPVVTTAQSRHIQIPFVFFHAVIAPSNETADYHHRFNLVPRSKLFVVSNLPGPLPSARTDRRVCRAEFGLGENDFVVSVVGSVCRRKNQVDALRILDKLLARHPDTKMLIVGRYPNNEPMPGWDRLVSSPQLRNHIILTGHREDAVELMASSDAILSTSLNEEGSMVVLEALSLGLPIVSYATGQVPEILTDGIDGYVVPMKDRASATERLVKLAENPELRERMGRQGRKRVVEFCDEGRILNEIDAIYEKTAMAAQRGFRFQLTGK